MKSSSNLFRLAGTCASLLAGMGSCLAGLIGVSPSFPQVSYTSSSLTSVSYDSTANTFTLTTTPTAVRFVAGGPPRVVSGTRSLIIQAEVNESGALVGGVAGDDFVLTGTVVDGANTYTGVLLKGEVHAFGFLESGVTDQYDFQLVPNGGQLLSFFNAGASINITSLSSTFAGDFGIDFAGRSQGILGAETLALDNEPPVITCPTDIVVECNANSGGLQGAYVSYSAVVTDNTDPNPTVTFTPPSGSFFELPAGQMTASYTVTVTAVDATGNSSECSFMVTVRDTMPPEFGSFPPELNGCVDPIILPNDAGQCKATYTFTLPVALDTCFTIPTPVPVTASAVDEQGSVITLTDLGNGQFQGMFPVNQTGSNVITFVADDGRGNTAQTQCEIVVEDVEAPSLACIDQTGTFKPVFERAFSCISARFNCNQIDAGETIWFSSAIRTPADHNAPFTIRAYDQRIELSIDGEITVIPVPEAYVTFDNGVATAMTTFVNGNWQTVTRPFLPRNVFLSGVSYVVPSTIDGCEGDRCQSSKCFYSRKHKPNVQATWCARFEVDRPGVFFRWAWAAATYSEFDQDYSQLGVKPVDAHFANPYLNHNAAGTPENYKAHVTAGGRGDGPRTSAGRHDRYTGVWTHLEKANMGVGSTCMGPVVFEAPLAADNCDENVTVTLTPPSGSVFGPGDHVITATATDASGNTSECQFTLTVLLPLQVVFESPCDDNINDNTRQEDEGWSDFNAPDDASTPQVLNRFGVGDNICHLVKLLDCNGEDVTQELISSGAVTVHIDVTEREGEYATSTIINDVVEQYVGAGSPGSIMVPFCGQFKYCLETQGYSPGTQETPRFYRSTVWVEYNSSPGIPVGMEDVILESR